MATLILTAVGTAVGGPIGGAIGAVLGQSIDQAVLGPKARHGPRLGDLSVQTSSYGSAIPKLFGTMRVAGTVIWATDLVESRSSGGGGKGRPKTVSYSYSASFAVALSARPIRAVRRIWADGKLLRGAAGDFKSTTGYRLHPGGEEQDPDPLIAAAEGAGQAPAYRGTAYAVFENFQLEDYGNRIPSLTFEIEADAGPVAIGAIAAALSGGAVSAGATPEVAGYAASGDSVRGALQALTDIVPLSLQDSGASLRLSVAEGEAFAIGRIEENGRRELIRRASAALAGEVSLTYYDPARDYQTGLQRAYRGAAQAARVDRRALAAALAAETAKAFAERRLAATWAERRNARLSLGWKRAELRPGDLVRLEGESGTWRIVRWRLGAMTVGLELAGAGVQGRPVAAGPGRPVLPPDLMAGETLLRFFDLPLGQESGAARPLLVAIAAGTEPGWRQAALEISYDEGTTWEAVGRTAAPAVVGTALGALEPGGSTLFDRRGSVEVELANGAMWLESRSDAALAGGANLALLGSELIQFGSAEPVGERRFRLSGLLRGRRGTEWAATGHVAGEGFALIDAAALVAIEAPLGSAGGSARLIAHGIGDSAPAEAGIPIGGERLRPPAPVHLKAVSAANGDVAISWIRRSRLGWSWASGSDTPLGEEQERYSVTISGGGAPDRTAAAAVPAYTYTAGEQAADGRSAPFLIAIRQIGTHAASHPAETSFS